MNKLSLPLQNRNIIILFSLQFSFVLIYFLTQGRHIFTFQENNFLLVLTPDYILPFLSKPGGITELLGKTITQFYYYPVAGAVILAITLIIPGIILYKSAGAGNSDSIWKTGYFYIIPAFLLMLMQTFYYHFMEYNIGIIIAVAWFYFTLYIYEKQLNVLPALLFPLFYYIAGGFAWVFIAMFLTFHITNYKNRKSLYALFSMLVVSVTTLIVFKTFIFLQPYKTLISFPLPDNNIRSYQIIFYALTLFLMLYPLFLKISISGNLVRKLFKPKIILLSYFILAGIGLTRLNNPQTIQAIEIQGNITKQEWDQAIQTHETNPSRNLIGQYFYNVALAETGQLCDRLFNGKQDFGPGSLVLPWKNEYLNWGVHFFYAIGLNNEAHRWAYEEMIVYGPKPQNVILLAKTNIINGNYERAEKYIHLLKHTMNYRKTGRDLEQINYNQQAIESNPEFMEKLNYKPKNDFFLDVSNPQNNIPVLLDGNPSNKQAIEYQMAWYLLSKDINSIISNMEKFKEAGYTKIPVHIEEAILAYENSTKEKVDLYGLQIRQETTDHFKKYVSSYKSLRNNQTVLKRKMEENYGHTFWFYFHFS